MLSSLCPVNWHQFFRLSNGFSMVFLTFTLELSFIMPSMFSIRLDYPVILVFLRMCKGHGVIPTGMQLRHTPADINNPYLAAHTGRLCRNTSFSLMQIHIESLSREVQRTERIVFAAKQHLMAIFEGHVSFHYPQGT